MLQICCFRYDLPCLMLQISFFCARLPNLMLQICYFRYDLPCLMLQISFFCARLPNLMFIRLVKRLFSSIYLILSDLFRTVQIIMTKTKHIIKSY